MAKAQPIAVEAARLTNDLGPYWMPFTANRQFKAQPRLLVGAKGLHYTTADGRRLLDGTAGLWCCNAGHGHPKIVAAIQRQAAEMDYAPAFQMGHPKAFELAARVAALLSGDLDHVFFTNSGSEAVDTALKIALAYHRARGDATRTRLVGRERGYHGVGFGGMSVGGIANNRKFFGPLLSRRRPSAAHPFARRRTPSAAASPRMARISPTSSSASSRCTTPPPSPR